MGTRNLKRLQGGYKVSFAKYDNRNNKTEEPCWREPLSLTVASGSDNQSTTLTKNGKVQNILFKVPALDGASGTAQLILLDEDGDQWWASAELAENTNHKIELDECLLGTSTWKVETSQTQTADRDFTIKLKGI